MFDHLDDNAPVEPTDELRDSVAHRAARIRRRRALAPGAALVVVAALAILGIATIANDKTAPERVVAGPSGRSAGGVSLSAQLVKQAVRVRIENNTNDDRRGSVQVCRTASSHTSGNGSSLSIKTKTCTQTTIEVRKQSTAQQDVSVRIAGGNASVVVSWNDLSADPVTAGPVTLRLGNVP